jgi:predicted ATP-grasp superfamily ATP-dependent carboligase
MLSAVVEDMSRIPGVEVQSLLNEDLFPTDQGPHFHRIDPATEVERFRELAAQADYTLVIAPEFDDILAERCDWVGQVGGRWLGPSAASIRVTADKYALGQHLKRNGVPTPGCWLLTSDIPEFPAVLKPRFGAGSLEMFLVQGPEDRPGFRSDGRLKDMIVQRFVAGQPASVAILIGSKQRLAMPAASQVLSADGRFHYLGGCIPLPEKLTARAQLLACRAVESVPGLLGYMGVDLVLGSATDGSEDWVIEINPRLTTSYIGLRALAESNLAQALIDIVIGKEVKPLKWRRGQVQFSCDGRVSFKT